MNDFIDDLVQRWESHPSAAATVALCDALCDNPRVSLVAHVGEVATRRHSGDVDVLVSVARMYIESDCLAEAQGVLVNAGKQAPQDARVFRWLGEVLLRRGDAERAQKVLERAIQIGISDTTTRLWLERARGFRQLQVTDGERAVAAEVAESTGVRARPPEVEDQARAQRSALPPARAAQSVRPRSAVPSPLPPRSPPLALAKLSLPPAARSVRPPAVAGNNGHAAPVASIPPAGAPSFSPPPMPPPMAPSIPAGAPSVSPPPMPHPMAPSVPPAGTASVPPRAAPNGFPSAEARSSEPPKAAWVPHPRDVMDALALAGIFEANAATAVAWDRAQPGPKRKGFGTIAGGLAMFLAAAAGTLVFYRQKRAHEHLLADQILTTVESQLHDARPDALPAAEKELSQAFKLDSRSTRAALDWARERALVGLLKGGADVAFEDAMARAKEVGVPEDKYAFAQVASFLLQGDTAGAASVLPRWDASAASDPWYQLVTGATLERAGDERSRRRYASAVQLDPQLVAAQVGLARITAIEGDAGQAMQLAKEMRGRFPDRVEPMALVALAWGRDPMRETTPAPPEVDALAARGGDDLPSGLKFVPHALSALRAFDRHAADEARAEISSGLAVAESPGAAVWLGMIALPLGDEALARKAAVTALQFSAVYEPARALAARVALVGGRLDEALKATEELEATSPQVVVVRAAAAYERLDPDGVARAFEALPAEARKLPSLAALAGAAGVLSGRTSLDTSALTALAAGDAPWSDLIAMDDALDGGDMSAASTIAASWGKESTSQPLRALRLARLARYEGRLDAADALSQTAIEQGTVTLRVLAERVFELVARGHAADVGPMLARYPLALGPMATWLSAYTAAAAGNVEAAKGKIASVDPPPLSSPFEMRLIAAAAFGAMKDKRHGADYVRSAMAGKPNPDVAAAAAALGLRPVRRGRHGVTYE